jgi:hypothetical protein
MEARYRNESQYDFPGQARSTSAPPQRKFIQNAQRGFVEPGEIMDDVCEPSRGSNLDMVNVLAQQASCMGISSDRVRDRNQKQGDMLKKLIGN